MVRAAVSGAIDYSRADPTDINWRLKQRLVLQEIQRREDVQLLTAEHREWLAYVAHGSLTDDSFAAVKKEASAALGRLQKAVFPWIKTPEPKPENDTILDDEAQKLVDAYKKWQAESPANKAEVDKK